MDPSRIPYGPPTSFEPLSWAGGSLPPSWYDALPALTPWGLMALLAIAAVAAGIWLGKRLRIR